jgi:hypothetical protein
MPRPLQIFSRTLLIVLLACAWVRLAAPEAEAGTPHAGDRARAHQQRDKRIKPAKKHVKRKACRSASRSKRRRASRRRMPRCARRRVPARAVPNSPSRASGLAPTPARRLFAPTSVWNSPLPANAPLDSRSPAFVAALTQEVTRETVGNTGPWISFDAYSVPVYSAGADTRTVRVTLDAHAPLLQRDFQAVPIPAGARAAAGSDKHLVVYQSSTDTMWEFWLAHRAADGWHAGWGGKMVDVSNNPGIFPKWYGASSTSLPLMGGLMRIDELLAGRIDHALALAIPNTAAGQFTWPAQRGDGRSAGPGAIPEGTHLRIDPSLDLSRLGLSPLALVMARAAQRYGIVVRDTSGCVTFFGQDPVTRPGDPYGRILGGQYPNKLLRGFPWSRLQVVAPRR